MVDYSISPYLTVLVFLEIDIYAETGFEDIKELLNLLLAFLAQWLAATVKDFTDV